MKPEDFDEELPFRPRKKMIGETQIKESWRNIHGQLREPLSGRRQRRTLIAAVITLVAACLLTGGYFLIPRYKTIKTAYGEIKRVYLPDSTRVVLNSNSSLKYPVRWKPEKRSVYLQGEAFFEVRKKPATGARFTVHTRRLDVEVLGTVFNVNAGARDRTEVSLSEGRVLVKTKKELAGGKRTISMEPGELIVVKEDSYKKTRTKKIMQRSAWINNDFYFDNTPIAEIATMIKRKYGYEVYFETDSLRHLKLSGNMHAENFIQFRKALEVTMKMNLTLRSDTLFIGAEKR